MNWLVFIAAATCGAFVGGIIVFLVVMWEIGKAFQR